MIGVLFFRFSLDSCTQMMSKLFRAVSTISSWIWLFLPLMLICSMFRESFFVCFGIGVEVMWFDLLLERMRLDLDLLRRLRLNLLLLVGLLFVEYGMLRKLQVIGMCVLGISKLSCIV